MTSKPIRPLRITLAEVVKQKDYPADLFDKISDAAEWTSNIWASLYKELNEGDFS